MPSFMGLGDLGFLKPTQSNKSDDMSKVDILGQLLEGSSELYDELGRARVIESEYNKLKASEAPSTLDRLLSPEGLINLIGTGAAGALGGPEAAVGFGIGRLGAIDASVEAVKAQKRKAMEELSEQHEKALERLDKSRQRFTSLLQAQPELFIDPQTGEQTVPPKLLGLYALGEPLPLSPLSKQAISRGNEAWEKTNSILTTQLENAQTDEDARKIIDALAINLKAPLPDDVKDTLARSRKNGTWNQATANMIADHFWNAAEVFTFAGENKLPLHDPRVMKMLIGNYRDPSASTDGPEVSDKFLEYGERISQWQKDPANAERNRQLKDESTTEKEYSLALATEVLGGERGAFDLYTKQASLIDPKDLSLIWSAYGDQKDENAIADAITGYENLPARAAMTPEQKRQADFANAQAQVKAAKQATQKQQGIETLSLVNAQAKRMQSELKINGQEAVNIAKDIAKEAMNRSTRPDGTVDRARFSQELIRLTDEIIQETKPAE